MKDFAHQAEAFERFKNEPYGALFHEQGCGKTRVAINLAEYHLIEGDVTAVLVVTTTGLVGNWSEVELPKHGTIKYDCFRWNTDRRLPATTRPLYFLVNIDAIITDRFPPFFKLFFKMHKKFMLVVDESTIAKNHRAKRTKRLLQIAAIATYRFILTGTPITHSPMDLYSQCAILDKEALGMRTVTQFKYHYAVEEQQYHGLRRYNTITSFKNLAELTAKLQTFASIVKKKDCLDIPDKIYRTFYVPFTKEQYTAYEELRIRALTYIQEHEISVVNAVSLINKLLQICCGQVKIGDQYLSIPNHRLQFVKDLVEECPGKTIIWTSYVNTATDLTKALGPLAVHLPSGLSLTARSAILGAFKTDSTRALIANPASAGHGIDLTESSNVIYYSNSWNYEHRAQSEDRPHRIGQTEHVLITDLITKGSVEERVVKLLLDKKAMANLVITNRVMVEFLSEPLKI